MQCVAYSDGALVTSSSCAAGLGTTLRVEDMFFSMPSRQRALRSGREEYGRMVRLISHYAVFWHDVSFNLRREGSTPDVSTPISALRLANIKCAPTRHSTPNATCRMLPVSVMTVAVMNPQETKVVVSDSSACPAEFVEHGWR